MQAADNEIKKLISEVSGILPEDEIASSQKKEVNLFDVFALSVKNTEKIAIDSETLIQSEARKSQAFGAFLPKIYLKTNRYYPDNYIYKSSSWDSVSLYARQPVITGLSEWSAFKSASSDVKMKKLLLYNNSQNLLLDISANFYSVIQIEKNLKNTEEMLNLYNLTINELNRRVSIGRSRKSDLQRTNTELYKIEASIKSIQSDLDHARTILKNLTGIDRNIKLIEGGNLPDPDSRIENISKIVNNRWDVKAANEAVNEADAGIIAAYGGHLPSVYLEGNYVLYHEKLKTSAASTRDYYLSLGVEIPIFTGGIVNARIKEARSVKRQAELNLSGIKRLAEQDIVDSIQNWEHDKEIIKINKKALDSATANYNIIVNEYKMNLATILDLITSLQSLQGAKNDYEKSLLQHKLNRIHIGVATNEFTGKNIILIKTNN